MAAPKTQMATPCDLDMADIRAPILRRIVPYYHGINSGKDNKIAFVTANSGCKVSSPRAGAYSVVQTRRLSKGAANRAGEGAAPAITSNRKRITSQPKPMPNKVGPASRD